jgi:hypothetical protein
MPNDLKHSILDSIPDQETLRQRLAENLQERDFLRKMLRLADQKAKVEQFQREAAADA